MNKKENIFITWHYTTHGVAYLKHILSAFHKLKLLNKKKITETTISQEDMVSVFDKKHTGDLFDKVYYLTAPQNTFDSLSARRFEYLDNILKDENINSKIKNIWKDLIKYRKQEKKRNNSLPSLFEEKIFVKNHYRDYYNDWLNTVWRDMHHYTIDDQFKWLIEDSNISNKYISGKNFIREIIDIKDFRNSIEISKKLMPFINKLKQKHKNANFIINASLGSNETQVVWQVFSEINILPFNTKLIQTYDDKLQKNTRFKNIIIKEIPNKIVTDIATQITLYDKNTKSESRKLAGLKMAQYLKSGFAILLLGERGIGKTKLAEEYKNDMNIVSVNCASFTNDLMAETTLFGDKNKKGLFEEADNGILFLDEIHNLSKLVQTKLLKALETDSKNNLTIRRVGIISEKKAIYKVNVRIILASNQPIYELRKSLLLDFYSRIAQLVIEIPPLRESVEDIPVEFEKIWSQMRFNETLNYDDYIKSDKQFITWIQKQKLYGNYRDLQKIAIYYKTFIDFNNEIKALIKQKNAFDFTKSEFKKYIHETKEPDGFPKDKTAEEIINEYKCKLANWFIEQFGSAIEVEKHFKRIGNSKKINKKTTTKETLYNWRNYCKKLQY